MADGLRETLAGHLARVYPGGIPDKLVPVRLVPVEVFGASCACHEDAELAADGERPCNDQGYGLMDAVLAWSDCNRAEGRIYRRDEDWSIRTDGDTILVWVPVGKMAKFEKRFGEEFGS